MPIFSPATRLWLHGLFAAFISTFATTVSGMVTLPTVFNFTKDGMINVVKLATVPAMIAVFTYLKTSPLPPDNVLGPGDKATLQDPVLTPDGTITGSSAVLQKAPTKE